MRRSAASANISSICSSTWTASERGRSATKSSALGRIVALADAACRTVAAAVGMLARPALVGLGQGRRRGGQCLGGIGRRIEDGCVLLGDRAVVGRALGEQRVLFEFLLDEGGELEMRELQQLDGLLKLRRHCQGLARSQDETRTDTHVPPP